MLTLHQIITGIILGLMVYVAIIEPLVMKKFKNNDQDRS